MAFRSDSFNLYYDHDWYERKVKEVQFRGMLSGTQAVQYDVSQPKHKCAIETPERHRAYYEGILNFKRNKGDEESKSIRQHEKECSDPKCLLSRIAK